MKAHLDSLRDRLKSKLIGPGGCSGAVIGPTVEKASAVANSSPVKQITVIGKCMIEE